MSMFTDWSAYIEFAAKHLRIVESPTIPTLYSVPIVVMVPTQLADKWTNGDKGSYKRNGSKKREKKRYNACQPIIRLLAHLIGCRSAKLVR